MSNETNNMEHLKDRKNIPYALGGFIVNLSCVRHCSLAGFGEGDLAQRLRGIQKLLNAR
ncbi:hypothetical protein [Methylomicrobium lacus]|uniref:hypothetical protein n=1 Tax=Methylomicrobium lacus TaxID=136992 RepID=UPI0035A845C1